MLTGTREWADATINGKYWDETYNPVIGCTKCSPGCENCWAERLHMQRHEAYWKSIMKDKQLPEQYMKKFSEIQLLPERLDRPLHWRKSRTIFVCNMGDLFHPAVPFEFIDKIWATMMWDSPQHEYLILTKRHDQMATYIEHNPYDSGNIWLGITICNQKEADKKITTLLQIPNNPRRWLSIEPMLGPVNLKLLEGHDVRAKSTLTGEPCTSNFDTGYSIDWIVLGCESGPNRRPCKIEWMIDVVEQCQAAGVPIFVKQVNINGKVSHKIEEWPEKLRVRDKFD